MNAHCTLTTVAVRVHKALCRTGRVINVHKYDDRRRSPCAQVHV